METEYKEKTNLPQRNAEAILSSLKENIASGKHWFIALLEAIGAWTDEEEVINGRLYSYLIASEAFDWLLLAERICQSLNGLLPEKEKIDLLFHGKLPLELPAEDFKNLIGGIKYSQYLNYFYGITVEEALLLAVLEEVRKERCASGIYHRINDDDEAYLRIYGNIQSDLQKSFREEKGHLQSDVYSLGRMKEFTYWLFKYRLKESEKAKAASDIQKALEWLKRNSYLREI